MFAYCGNNPVVHEDDAGNMRKPTTVAIHDQGIFGDKHFGTISSNYMENTGKVLNNPIGFVADEVLGSLSFIVKSGITKIVQGIGNVAAGLMFIIAPIPTYADDYYGVKMVAKGVYKIARGFRKFAAILEE